MTLPDTKHDKTVGVICGQLEMLAELALKAGETALAADLSAALAGALYRVSDATGRMPDAFREAFEARDRQAG